MPDFVLAIFVFVAGFILGGGAMWAVARTTEQRWADKFKAIAADSLRQSNETFLQLAESRLKQSEQIAATTLDKKSTAIDEMVKPVKESLQKMGEHLQALEVKREGAYRELLETVQASRETHQQLRGETSQLLQALRTPTTRGHWGEMQLKRILEMTGMSVHVKDFTLQPSIADGALRPDVIVHLPGNRCIVIDSKVPLAAFMDATQSIDEAGRQAAMKQHARHLREHVKVLGAKAYWEQIEGTPEFVVLFLPGDHFLSAALDSEPELMDYSIAQRVVLATPMTLIALLRTVTYGWRQESLRENARKVGLLGGELYGALVGMTHHITSLGDKLAGGLTAYNQLIGSLEKNVLGKARKLRDFGAGKDGKMLPEEIEPIDIQTRGLTAIANEESEAKEDAA